MGSTLQSCRICNTVILVGVTYNWQNLATDNNQSKNPTEMGPDYKIPIDLMSVASL
jgi:hypothetical protein